LRIDALSRQIEIEMKRLFAILCVSGLIGASHAITGTDATGIINVTETITDEGSGKSLYTFQFTNEAASAPIWLFGVYTDTPSGSVGGFTATLGGTYTNSSSSGYTEAGYDGSDSVAGSYNPNESGPPDVGHLQTGTLSFTANSGDIGSTVFFAEVEGQNDSIPDGQSEIQFSYKGTFTPDSTPEPSLMAFIGLAGIGTAFARRRKR
jgi:hypothetical protein